MVELHKICTIIVFTILLCLVLFYGSYFHSNKHHGNTYIDKLVDDLPRYSILKNKTIKLDTGTSGFLRRLGQNTTFGLMSKSRKPPLLTIFTTLLDKHEKFYIHRNVILNWASFGSKVQPILFANLAKYSPLNIFANLAGWLVLPIPRTNIYGTPFLKDMYRQTAKLTNSPFQGFCNGDILFDGGLVKTLEDISTIVRDRKSILVIGRRTNVPVREDMETPLFTAEAVTWEARHKGKLFFDMAEDYFLIKHPQLFPWHTIKDVVIGRPRYDNHMVSQAIQGGVSVVDATPTILAMHETGADGNKAGEHKKSSAYNMEVLGSRDPIPLGGTNSAPYVTSFDIKGQVLLWKRPAPKPQHTTPQEARVTRAPSEAKKKNK